MAVASPIMSPTSSVFRPRNNFLKFLALALFGLALFFFTLSPSAERIRSIPEQLEKQVNGGSKAVSSSTQKPVAEDVLVLPSPVPQVRPAAVPDCVADVDHLRSLQNGYELSDKIEYARREILFHRQDIPRKSLTKVDAELFPATFDVIDLGDEVGDIYQGTSCHEPFNVPVSNSPFPGDVDASEFLFGVSTTFNRLNDQVVGPIKEWSHWLTNGHGQSNGAGMILRLVDASDRQINETQTKLRGIGMDVKVYHSDGGIAMAQRYLSLLPALHNDDSIDRRKWLVMCDDDTFFPSINALKQRMTRYDPNKELYIGTLSEDVFNIERHGSQAFGGAGVFFTKPLAAMIERYYPACSTDAKLRESDSGWGPQGDVMLRKCIYENTEVRLTALDDLWQLDLFGDPAGFYESGRKPLSLHHFKGGMWHHAKPYTGAYISTICGEDCFLQRFQTKDNFIIANGYSIAKYPFGIDFDVAQTERTFDAAPDDKGWNFDYAFGPQRESLSATGRKYAWELMESVMQDDGSMRQSYVRRAHDRRWVDHREQGQPVFKLDGVLDLIWRAAL